MRSAFLAILILLTVGCRVEPRQRVVGNWALDRSKTVIPATPFPDAERQVRRMMRSFNVKFSANGTAYLTGPAAVDGVWTYENGTVLLVPKEGGVMSQLPMGQESIEFEVDKSFKTMTWKPQTPFGEMIVVFRKTG